MMLTICIAVKQGFLKNKKDILAYSIIDPKISKSRAYLRDSIENQFSLQW